jgi:predicted DNA-binding transcriptional regulator YafY
VNRNDRLIGMLLALQNGRKTAAQLAERFDVSRRTILRDIDALSQVGVPVVALPGAGGFWLSPIQLTADEASLLLMGLKSLGDPEGSPFGLARASAEEKLRVILPAKVLADAQREIDAIDFPTPHRPERLGHLADLRRAMRDHRWVRIAYRSVRRVGHHDIRPDRLYVEHQRWYVAALSHSAGESRTFRVDRILSITAIPEPIERLTAPASSPLEFVHVDVKLSFTALRWLEDHPDLARDVTETASGGRLKFDSPSSELDYFARELFALGPEAVVIEPVILRAKIRELAAATLDNHANDGDGTLSLNAQ